MKIRLFSDLILLIAVSVSLYWYVHVHAGSQKFKHLDLLLKELQEFVKNPPFILAMNFS